MEHKMQTNNQTKVITDQIRVLIGQLIEIRIPKEILDNIPETDDTWDIPNDIISEVPELIATGNSVLDRLIKRVLNFGSFLEGQMVPELWVLTTLSFIYAEAVDKTTGAIRTLHDTLSDPTSRQQLIEDARTNTVKNLEEIQKGFEKLNNLKNQIENIKIPEEGDEMYTVDHVATDVASEIEETVNVNFKALEEKYTKALEQAFEEYENMKEENMNTDTQENTTEGNITEEQIKEEFKSIKIVSSKKNMFLYLGSAVIIGAAIGIAARKLIDYYAEQSA